MNPDDLARCDAAHVAGILRDVISRPHRLVLSNEPPDGDGMVWATFHVWQFLLAWKGGRLLVREAACPEALKPCGWWLGCERTDWLDPESDVVEPVALLTPAERADLLSVVMFADIEPPVDCVDLGPSLESVAERRPPKRRRQSSRRDLIGVWGPPPA